MKKLLSIILSVCMLLSITAGLNLTAYADTYNGDCGTGVTWELDTETCELIISGTGDMEDYASYTDEPWFSYCSSIKTVTINSGVTNIGNHAFCFCTALTSIDVEPSNTVYSSEDGVLFNKDKTTLLVYPIGKPETSYTIPNSVTSIGDDTFMNCKILTSVTIPNSVTSIGNYAFAYCTKLTSVTISNNITTIGEATFSSCTGLTSVTIPNSVTSIGYAAFNNCTGLTDVYYTGSEDQWNSISISNSSNDYLINATRHYNYVPLCAECTWDSGTVTTPASCTETGVMTYKCTVCTEGTKTEIIPMTEHTPEVMPAVPATCTETGLTEGSKCAECGEILTAQTTVAAKGHTPEVIPAVAPTCTKTGLTEGSKCSVCGKIFTEQTTTPMTAHTPEVIPAVAATTESTGLTEGSKCSVCGTILVAQKVVDKLPTPTPEPATTATTTTTPTTTTTDTPAATTTKVSVPKITLKTVKSKKSKQVTVTWKKNTKVTGYEIQYSTDKKFKKSVKKATIKKNKTTSTTLKKLNGKKKYYVRIRAYKTVNGKKYYSSWSKAMTVTTKK